MLPVVRAIDLLLTAAHRVVRVSPSFLLEPIIIMRSPLLAVCEFSDLILHGSEHPVQSDR